MCGIIITKDKSKIPLIKHRGIESHFHKEFGFYIGHHRLPIQTLEGDEFIQPIQLKNGGYLLYNGEIFNTPIGYNSDVEYLSDVFNNLTLRDILQLANKWDGFWAIVHVSPDGFMSCFTDPLGKKQLYYNERGEICSEIRPLIPDESKFDKIYKSSVYKWGYTTRDRTPWEGVKRIVPNKLYVFARGHLLDIWNEEYYDWNANLPKDCLENLMYDSVKNRLVSKKYEIGALVSGGLDSAIIAAILEELDAKVNYYTVENGESKYADLLALRLGISLTYMDYGFGESERESFEYNETPVDLGSVLPQHKLMSVIPEKIVLTGDGADELFGGYRRINTYDSQMSDVFEELPYYHLPRLDRASMRYTIELRSPFLSHDIIKYALKLPYDRRKNKNHLKDCFGHLLPKEIVHRDKLPLKNPYLKKDAEEYKKTIFDLFYNKMSWDKKN